MKAIILAGGEGTRLRPYTNIIPKPLMPIGNYAILDIIIRQLKKHDIKDIVIAVGYLSQLIEAYFGDGKKWDVDIVYSREDKPLGTAGPISNVENINTDFIVMNGDILTSLNFSDLVLHHKKIKPLSTIVTYRKKLKIELGTLELDNNFMIKKYIEKPTIEYTISTGIYVFNSLVKNYIKKGCYLDLPNLINTLINNNEKVINYNLDGIWYDLGRKEDYEEVNSIYSDKIHEIFL